MMAEPNVEVSVQESAITAEVSAQTPDLTVEIIASQGPKGDPGEKGNGIASVEWTNDDRLVLTLDNGEGIVTPPLRGSDGIGYPGKDGYTPVKGVDYWTEADRQQILEDVAAQSASVIENTASGEAISVSDAADGPLRGLRLFGRTAQDGTPTPDAPVELVNAGNDGSIGVMLSGKNLLSLDALSIPDNNNNSRLFYADSGLLLPAGSYTLSIAMNCSAVYGRDYNSRSAIYKAYGATYLTFTLDRPQMLYFEFYNDGGFAEGILNTAQLEFGSTATEYAEGKIQSLSISVPNGLSGIPVSSGGNYTDANGQQWICDEIDLARGVYVQRILKVVFDGSDDEAWSTSGTQTEGKKRHIIILNGVVYPETAASAPVLMCSHYESASSNGTYTNKTAVSLQTWGLPNVAVLIYDPDYAEATSAAWKAHIAENPITCLFQLANPIETYLSVEEIAAFKSLHTHKPNTTVLNDSGAGMQADYAADTKLYIDNKFALLAAALVANT